MAGTKGTFYQIGGFAFVFITVLAVYVLSYGPFYWCVWTLESPQLERVAGIIYWPIDLHVEYGPALITDALVKYCEFWYPG